MSIEAVVAGEPVESELEAHLQACARMPARAGGRAPIEATSPAQPAPAVRPELLAGRSDAFVVNAGGPEQSFDLAFNVVVSLRRSACWGRSE